MNTESKIQWVEPAPWNSLPGVCDIRHKALYESRRTYLRGNAHLVPDFGYDYYLDAFMAKPTEFLEMQLEHPSGMKANVQNAVVCENVVKALKDAVVKKREFDEMAKHSMDLVCFALDGPPPKHPRLAEPPAPPSEEMVIRHVPCGPKGATMRVEVPRSLDAGD